MNPYRLLSFKVRHESKPRSKWKTLVWKFLIWSKGTWRERFTRWKCESCSWQQINQKVPGSGYTPNRTILHMIRYHGKKLKSERTHDEMFY